MKYVATILTLVVGLIYWPLNMFYVWVQKWYFKQRDHDRVMYWLFAPFYWLLVAIVTIISYPYELLLKFTQH